MKSDSNSMFGDIPNDDKQIGFSDGKGGVISFCCHERRHAECMGLLEEDWHNLRIKCACKCHRAKSKTDEIERNG